MNTWLIIVICILVIDVLYGLSCILIGKIREALAEMDKNEAGYYSNDPKKPGGEE